MKTTEGIAITPLKAARRIFYTFGASSLQSAWGEKTAPHTGLAAETATEKEQKKVNALLIKIADRLAKKWFV